MAARKRPGTTSRRGGRVIAGFAPQILAAVNEFCGVCLDAVESGGKKKVFARAASSLGVDAEAVSGSVMALTDLLHTAAKVRLDLCLESAQSARASLSEVFVSEGSGSCVCSPHLPRSCALTRLSCTRSCARQRATSAMPSLMLGCRRRTEK